MYKYKTSPSIVTLFFTQRIESHERRNVSVLYHNSASKIIKQPTGTFSAIFKNRTMIKATYFQALNKVSYFK